MSGKEELKVYTEEEIKEKLKELSGWYLEGGYLAREYHTKNWKETIFLLNVMAGLAEAYWHHYTGRANRKSLFTFTEKVI